MRKVKSDKDKTIRPTVAFSSEENKLIEHYCVDLDVNKGEFIKMAALYCVEKEIDPRK